MLSAARRGLTLLIDADDTLWENNIYFEEIVAHYVDLVGRYGHSPDTARATLLEIEHRRTRHYGYGIDNFRHSLDAACEQLLDGHAYHHELGRFDELCFTLRRRPIALLPEVDETLRELGGRHRLILLTKGDPDDQQAKVVRSGIRHRFHAVDVVMEKDAATYEDVIRRHGVDRSRGWMVGNSPKSDILPALAVGLRTVFVPHAATWQLELQELPTVEDGRLLVLERFADLTRHF
jgi:putative hydrolase of the HAD superfamily